MSDTQPVEPQPEPMSDWQRLEKLLHQLADDIDADGDDKAHLHWARQVRDAAGLVGRGKVWGPRLFLELFDPIGRPFDQPYPVPNPFTERAFARTRTCDKAYRLATELLDEREREAARRETEREVVLRPWLEGCSGKAVVYEDGTVVATRDDEDGGPRLPEIRTASRPDEDPVAELAVRASGLCATYRSRCDRQWLADRLREHDPGLRLEQKPPRG